MYNIFLIKKEKELIGKDVVLKKPKRENWKEWAELRQRSREFLQPWEPKWPNNFLTKDSFISFIMFLITYFIKYHYSTILNLLLNVLH